MVAIVIRRAIAIVVAVAVIVHRTVAIAIFIDVVVCCAVTVDCQDADGKRGKKSCRVVVSPVTVASCRVMRTYSKKYSCYVLMYLRGNSIGTDGPDQTDRQTDRHTLNLSFYRTSQ